MALIIVFGYAFSWMYAAIGLATKDPETAQVAGILPFFILDVRQQRHRPRRHDAGLAPGLRPQPALSVTVAAVRALLEGGPAAHWVWQSLAWSAGIFVVFFTISLVLYHRSVS